MQQRMTRWIEAADARAVCEEAMAQRMVAEPAEPTAPRSLLGMLRLQLSLQPVNRRFGPGTTARADG